jgi:Ca2+-binding RTX toxin-like protein
MATRNGTNGNDTLNGSEGGNVNDVLNGKLGDDLYRYTLGSGNDLITDTGGVDTIELDDPLGLFKGWTVYRSSNDMVIDFYGQGRITVKDQFLTAPVIENLAFSNGSQPLTFSNLLTGSAGEDVLVGTSSGEAINGGDGDDLIFGNEGNDTLSGGDGDDELYGGSGDDILYGGAGDDTFDGQGGLSVINGGDGHDEVAYSLEAGRVIINLSGFVQNVSGHLLFSGRVLHADGLTEDTLISIESVTGTPFADVFYASSTSYSSFTGMAGNDTIVGGTMQGSWLGVNNWDSAQGIIVNLSNASITVGGVTVASKTARDGHGDTDTFILSAGGIDIDGSDHDDYIRGRDDAGIWIDGNAGNDTLEGGIFVDTVSYHEDPEEGGVYGAIVNLSASSITVTGVTGHAGSVTVAAHQARDCFGDTDTLISIERVQASDFDDYLVGSSGNDWLDGSEGNDTLHGGAGSDGLYGGDGDDTLSGGADSDLFNIWSSFGDTSVDTITDFTVGSGGDNLSISTWLFSNFTPGGNPFGSGHARLTQSGANTLLELDTDGPDGAAAFQTAAILNNVSKSDLVAENLSGFNANAIVGTAGADTLSGTTGNDLINGGAGNDTLNGLAGEDTLFGGTDDDVLNGGAGNDQLYGDDGNDVLNGGSGYDNLSGGLGNDTLTGGADSDYFNIWSSFGDTSVDTITDFTVGTGIGADQLFIPFWGFSNFLAGGNPFGSGHARLTQSGANTLIEFDIDGPGGAAAFQTAAILNNVIKSDLVAYNLGGFSPNAIVGTTGPDALSGTTGDDWIEGGFGNDTLNGLAGDDTLQGGADDDVLNGGDGNDQLNGDDGNDVLSGGSGYDYLSGGLGNDTLTGGADSDYFNIWSSFGDTSVDTITDFVVGTGLGADRLSIPFWAFSNVAPGGNPFGSGYARLTQSGANTLIEFDFDGSGGAAAFQTAAILNNVIKSDLVAYNLGGFSPNAIVGTTGPDALSGTTGDDWIEGGFGNDTLNGLAGDDTLQGGADDDVLNGGDGNDQLNGDDGNDVLSGGSGYDDLSGGLGNDTLTGGADSDYFNIWSSFGDTSVDTITDFVVGSGVGRDNLSMPTWLFSNFTPGGNPFSSGHARLTQSGANTLLEFDTDGSGGAAAFQTVAILNNVSKSDVVADNLSGFNPNAIVGTAGADTLSGTSGNDWIGGGAGNDTLNGLAGEDTLQGGADDDVLNGGDGNDQLNGDDGNDVLSGGSGYDNLSGDLGNDTLTGGADSDYFDIWSSFGDTSVDTITDFVAGNSFGADQLFIPTWLFSNFAPGDNPFASGHARLTQSGANTLIEFDTDGPGGAAAFQTAAILNNVNKADLLAMNLGGFSPHLTNTIVGTPAADLLNGTAGDDSIDGAAGNDTLNGLAGDDTLEGGSGDDALYGGDGNDSLDGSAGKDTLDGGTGNDTMLGGDGNDYYYVRDSGDIVSESNATASTGGTDLVYSYLSSYTLGANVENGRIVTSTAANLSGNSLDNYLYAGAGNNVIDGGAGSDTVTYYYGVSGTTGVIVSLATTAAQATGGSGTDTLTAIEHLRGSNNADKLTGNSGANRLEGYAGNDTLDGGAGNDTMIGGDGNDYYYVRDSGDSVSETNATASTGGTDTVLIYVSSYTLGANVENGRIVASAAANLSGNSLDNFLYAGAGNNAIDGGAGSDTVSYYYGVSGTTGVIVSLATTAAQATGGSGTDTLMAIEHLRGSNNADKLTGNSGANRLEGYAGNDTLDGGAGNDTMLGGDGNDYYYVRDSGDSVSETNATASTGGTDTVLSYLSSYTLGANVENGRIVSSAAAKLSGNSLNNFLYAGAGDNVINGSAGSDTVSYYYGVSGTTGVTVSLATTAAQATGGSGTDTLTAIEHLRGSNNADKLTGNSGANRLEGYAGNDTLNGGLGNDTLIGGSGSDSIRFDTLLNALSNRDTISDFDVAADSIELENAIFSSLSSTGTLAAGSFRSAAGVSASDANDFILYDSASGALHYDADGNGAGLAVQFASLSSGLALSNADFLVT